MINSMRSGASAIPEANVLQFITDYISQSGIANVSAGQFLVTANASLSVNVAAGRAYLLASGGSCYPIINNAAITVSVNSNSSGNPRITSIVLYENLGNTPNSDGSNTATVTTVDGTPVASPSAPSGSTIQSSVGAGNPYTVLCNVTVPSGASNLSTQGTLVDVRVQASFNLPRSTPQLFGKGTQVGRFGHAGSELPGIPVRQTSANNMMAAVYIQFQIPFASGITVTPSVANVNAFLPLSNVNYATSGNGGTITTTLIGDTNGNTTGMVVNVQNNTSFTAGMIVHVDFDWSVTGS